jgi:tRNA(fMet)-specific endonuclease VapC
MKYVLDTDISSYIINKNYQSVIEKFWEHRNDDICISSITYAELMFGKVHKKSLKMDGQIKALISRIAVIDFDMAAAEAYGEIRELLTRRGKPIGNMDMLIAACAKSRGAVLVTNNSNHFLHIPGLAQENWVAK